jgi:hypothetical protein
LVTVVVFFVNDYLLLENLKNIISFTRFLRKICTNHHYTEKNGTGVTLKWKRGNHILFCGRSGRKKGFSAFMQQVPFLLKAP